MRRSDGAISGSSLTGSTGGGRCRATAAGGFDGASADRAGRSGAGAVAGEERATTPSRRRKPFLRATGSF
jgi:hypothetical protein